MSSLPMPMLNSLMFVFVVLIMHGFIASVLTTYFPPEENYWQLIHKEERREAIYKKWKKQINEFCDPKVNYSELIIEGEE